MRVSGRMSVEMKLLESESANSKSWAENSANWSIAESALSKEEKSAKRMEVHLGLMMDSRLARMKTQLGGELVPGSGMGR